MKNLLFVAYLLFLFSCANDDDQPKPPHCLDTLDQPVSFTCEIFTSQVAYCDTSILGNLFLTEESKLFIPQYCQPISDNIIMRNNNNESLNFKILEKRYGRSRTQSSYFGTCGLVALCYQPEEARIVAMSSEIGLTLKIELRNVVEKIDPNQDRSGVRLAIYEEENEFSELVMQEIVDQGNLTFDSYPETLTIETLNLNGDEYADVISNEPEIGENQYFYNKEFGLIGFLDKNGTTWSLNR